MKKEAKAILDNLMAKISSETAAGFLRERLFSDGIKIPCRNWSFLNQLITFAEGTRDARGIKQWNSAGRKVKKGARAFHIFVPMLYPQNTAEQTDKGGEPESGNTVKTLTGFKLMPVFAVEDTEGEPLDYEERLKSLDVDKLPLIDIAKSLGVTVRAGLTFDGCAGSFHPGKNRITMGTACKQVFLHELSHAVDNILPGKSDDYAFNEVTAELSAAFLGSLYNVNIDIASTKAYIKNWSGKGHTAFKVADALERVEQIYKRIRAVEIKLRKQKVPVRLRKGLPVQRDNGLFRTEPIKDRSQTFNTVIGKWVKWDDNTGRFCSIKKDGKPFNRIVRSETKQFYDPTGNEAG